MKKKIIAHLSIILILVGVFCNVCTTYNRISVFDNSVYAEADNWTSCDSSDLVTAFRYYCKSRNLALEGSVADALTSFTTSTFNNLCSTLGIDPTSLSAELKKTTEGNLGLRFLFSNTGITAYNRIFAEFLQNNDLSVGDEVENEQIYSGEWFEDDNGNGCYVTVHLNNNRIATNSNIQLGTVYRYTGAQAFALTGNGYNNTSFAINYKGNTYTASLSINTSYHDRVNISGAAGNQILYRNNYYDGFVNIVRAGDNLYVGGYYHNAFDYSTNIKNSAGVILLGEVEDGDLESGNIYITTNNNTINNNVYNNNYTIIYNGGDTYISDDDDEPLPTTPPDGGGGGGGGDNPDNPDFPPVDPTPTPNPTIPDWDIELPEMPVGNDWLLYGLEKKFPWDIPYNLMYMLSLFAEDPETPHFEGTIDLKIVQWDYDIDLAPFDDIAGYVRDIEFIGFLLGLMLLTRKLIWG